MDGVGDAGTGRRVSAILRLRQPCDYSDEPRARDGAQVATQTSSRAPDRGRLMHLDNERPCGTDFVYGASRAAT